MSLHIWKRFLQGKEVCEQPTFTATASPLRMPLNWASSFQGHRVTFLVWFPDILSGSLLFLESLWLYHKYLVPPWEEVDEVGWPPSATLSRRKAQEWQPQSCGIIIMTLVLHHSSWKESSQTSSVEGLKSGVSCGQRAACLSVGSQKNPVASLRPGESPGANLCGWFVCWPGKGFNPCFTFKASVCFTKRKLELPLVTFLLMKPKKSS